MEKNKVNLLIDGLSNKEFILFFSLFSGWQLSFPFLGQVLDGLYSKNGINLNNLSLFVTGSAFLGLITAGYFIDDIIKAKRSFLIISYISIIGSLIFFLPYSNIWNIVIVILSFIGGVYVAAGGYYYSLYPKDLRLKTIGQILILSNIIMIIINTISMNISPSLGLGLAILSLILSMVFLNKSKDEIKKDKNTKNSNIMDNINVIGLLYGFIAIITITSGLMYAVINPIFSHHKVLTSIYWAIPYIFVIYILMKYPEKVNGPYVLYIAITLIGISFLLFLVLDRSWISYIIINTIMMSAFGVCDLFWWSIIGELLDYGKNPAKLLGLGLSANILGIFIGNTIGVKILNVSNGINPSIIALVIIFIILIILPLLNKYLSLIISEHIFLFKLYRGEEEFQGEAVDHVKRYPNLTDRENEVVDLLFRGRTYKMIAEELCLSQNTIKTHVRNIYSKYNVISKSELIKTIQKNSYD